ncbi:hypothetical protein PFFCH_02182 [Plasmodium falciparum FCH/4]|uniref:Uncharacterized protein n=1 Tax=Plasmodium falciparum FCH/4 TaxID=1036724 RepID=A0A024VPP2_PLAFA|nr:hypothetical protein PFFCH_02182 [Plasmodium falciparum FCH/4]
MLMIIMLISLRTRCDTNNFLNCSGEKEEGEEEIISTNLKRINDDMNILGRILNDERNIKITDINPLNDNFKNPKLRKHSPNNKKNKNKIGQIKFHIVGYDKKKITKYLTPSMISSIQKRLMNKNKKTNVNVNVNMSNGRVLPFFPKEYFLHSSTHEKKDKMATKKNNKEESIINERLLENLENISLSRTIKDIRGEEGNERKVKEEDNNIKEEGNSFKKYFKGVVKLYVDITEPNLEMIWQNYPPKSINNESNNNNNESNNNNNESNNNNNGNTCGNNNNNSLNFYKKDDNFALVNESYKNNFDKNDENKLETSKEKKENESYEKVFKIDKEENMEDTSKDIINEHIYKDIQHNDENNNVINQGEEKEQSASSLIQDPSYISNILGKINPNVNVFDKKEGDSDKEKNKE